ncbi:MAG: hypothetical protein C5B57_08490, partial [Blastocatellia bacterium]
MIQKVITATSAIFPIIALVSLSSPLAGQVTTVSKDHTSVAASKATPWTPPRTPWGDPDLQGTFTTDNSIGVPFERPPQYAGRTQLTDEEF